MNCSVRRWNVLYSICQIIHLFSNKTTKFLFFSYCNSPFCLSHNVVLSVSWQFNIYQVIYKWLIYQIRRLPLISMGTKIILLVLIIISTGNSLLLNWSVLFNKLSVIFLRRVFFFFWPLKYEELTTKSYLTSTVNTIPTIIYLIFLYGECSFFNYLRLFLDSSPIHFIPACKIYIVLFLKIFKVLFYICIYCSIHYRLYDCIDC